MKRNKVRLAERRASAAVRKAASMLLTPAQKLAKLDQAFGPGVGAKRERARLAEQIKNPPKPVTKEVAQAVAGVAETQSDIVVSKKTRPRQGTKAPVRRLPPLDPAQIKMNSGLEES